MTLFFHCASGPPAANPWTSGSKTHGRPRPGTGCLPAISYVQRAPMDLRQQTHGRPRPRTCCLPDLVHAAAIHAAATRVRVAIECCMVPSREAFVISDNLVEYFLDLGVLVLVGLCLHKNPVPFLPNQERYQQLFAQPEKEVYLRFILPLYQFIEGFLFPHGDLEKL